MLLDCGGEIDARLELQSNPWASLVPHRAVDHHGSCNFSNRYLVAARSRES
jgi:hypothetical protein